MYKIVFVYVNFIVLCASNVDSKLCVTEVSVIVLLLARLTPSATLYVTLAFLRYNFKSIVNFVLNFSHNILDMSYILIYEKIEKSIFYITHTVLPQLKKVKIIKKQPFCGYRKIKFYLCIWGLDFNLFMAYFWLTPQKLEI